MSVGDRIKRVRNSRGLTQRALGIRAGFDESTADVRVNQYEAGLRKPEEPGIMAPENPAIKYAVRAKERSRKPLLLRGSRDLGDHSHSASYS